MTESEYLMKAREAEAVASRANDSVERRAWEDIAKEYRRLADAVAATRQGEFPDEPPRH